MEEIHLKKIILATKTPNGLDNSETMVWVDSKVYDWLLRDFNKTNRSVRFFDNKDDSFEWRYRKEE